MNIDDMGPLPKIHPRSDITTAASLDLAVAISDIVRRHNLTTGEALQVVNGAASDWIGNLSKMAIRRERHGNTDTPGDTER